MELKEEIDADRKAIIPCVFDGSPSAMAYKDPILQGIWFVECRKCDARGPSATSKKKAILAWTSVEMKAWPVGGTCPKGFGNEVQAKAHALKH